MIFTPGEATSRLLFRILNARGAAPRESMHSLGLRDVLVTGSETKRRRNAGRTREQAKQKKKKRMEAKVKNGGGYRGTWKRIDISFRRCRFRRPR